MTTWFVSRHPGAIEWLKNQKIPVDEFVSHLDVKIIKNGDVVIGSLPVNLAAVVCSKGARYFNLSIELTAELRGKELSAAELVNCNAKLEEILVFPASHQ
jgi:CRISPR-associated protein Csx16